MQWVYGTDCWSWIGAGDGDPKNVFIGEANTPEVIGRPDGDARSQVVDRDLVAIQFPAFKESAGTGQEPIRVLAMSKLEAEGLVEQLKAACDAVGRGDRYDSAEEATPQT